MAKKLPPWLADEEEPAPKKGPKAKGKAKAKTTMKKGKKPC